MSQLKRTPLFEVYKDYGAKTIDFGGWDLPVQFSSIKEEHEAVRTKAGLFDVSHMGEIEVKGTDSLKYLQKMMTNDISKLKNSGAQYTAMCYENGGTVDDLLVYKIEDDHYLLVVNASNIEKDFNWLQDHAEGNVELKNLSEDMAQLAIQGPLAEKVLQKLAGTNLSDIGFFKFQQDVDLNGKKALVSRTGYTGEDGFEVYCDAQDAVALWIEILEAGKEEGVLPCGLGARDTLRFEANLALYGQELSPEITPLEAGIGFAVKVNKEADFIGKEVLKNQKENGVPRKLAGIEMIDRGIPRHGYPVYKGEELIGEVTTGTQSPTLKKNIGLVLIKKEHAEPGTDLEVEIRGKRLKAKIAATPFYKREKN
ncbi:MULTISPECIES: glycine cleavage system aminomethyltransferase GcvT [Cytobacillus]|jgi:aminomethyltransferase|uniref:Aminomethyltransferase n=3 Tax=Cytobacillus TaxID=2675230 RepID=A0A160ME71_9BACI|nr:MULTISPECIES: glycine cleavage system aminomethyltransferase GcvT [Cytobacillus]MBY0154534.1 glycine cleavage system aminomethyltransferase GcvT [Cytobacillus firmus]AND41407.1 glycine cleavage system protein T [Cytobacillus oceanisediminis 2691]MCM3242216.1 glycine cleavage system aminomethyltransferase GcvT [Cytobacillus oceanisediminis]MCM3393752.1 glycine cleavage system aminomethyltransferase GcvT [Cytobacillus oceanisediminis]MCM3401377.1 glycine cleavage system aminomethyltransferase